MPEGIVSSDGAADLLRPAAAAAAIGYAAATAMFAMSPNAHQTRIPKRACPANTIGCVPKTRQDAQLSPKRSARKTLRVFVLLITAISFSMMALIEVLQRLG